MQLPYIEKGGYFSSLKYARDWQCLQDSKFWLSKEPRMRLMNMKRKKKVFEEKVRAQKVDNAGQYDETDT